ncbi:MAG: mRNA surveillance protein pelota [archaeon]
MKLLGLNIKTQEFSFMAESLDDLWLLERILETGDMISGTSLRRYRANEEGKSEKKKVWVQVKTEKIELQSENECLRVTGSIMASKPEEFAPLKEHHSLDISFGKKIKVRKEKLKQFQIEKLKKAGQALKENILVVVLDDEQANLAIVKERGLDVKATIYSGKQGKQFESKSNVGNYFKELSDRIKELKPEHVLIAGPGHIKQDFEKFLKDKKIELKAVFGSTNSVGLTGLQEVLKTGLLSRVVKESVLEKETILVEKAVELIAKDSRQVEYGLEKVKFAVQARAVKELLVSDKTFNLKRREIEELMENTEKAGGIIHLINSEHEAGKKLEGLSGIIALLKFGVR